VRNVQHAATSWVFSGEDYLASPDHNLAKTQEMLKNLSFAMDRFDSPPGSPCFAQKNGDQHV
jgi:hypothetical protein